MTPSNDTRNMSGAGPLRPHDRNRMGLETAASRGEGANVVSDVPTQVLEMRCPEGHRLGTAWIPSEYLQPDEPAVHLSARCVRCKIDVESAFVPLWKETTNEDQSVWRRQRRSEFQIRCSDDRHRLARVSIPVKFLARGRPPLRFEVRCCTCQEFCEATFTQAVPITQAPAASTTPRAAALRAL